jgi:O-antigen/teichoic acid export membrane protein
MRVIIKNVLSNWAGFLVYTAVAFYLSPFLIHSLGKEIYGLWVLVGSLTGYMGILDMGVRSAIVKYTSAYFTKKDFKELSNIVNNSITLFSIFSCVILVVVAVLFFFLEDIFVIKPEMLTTSRIVFVIMGINLALVFPLNVFGGMISGLQRYEISNGVSIIFTILKLVLLIVFINMGYGIIALAVVTVGLDQINKLIFFVAIKKLIPEYKFKFFAYNKEASKKILKFSFQTFLIVISDMAVYYSDSIIIGAFLALTTVTFYIVAWTLLDYLRKIVNRIAYVLMPAASEMDANKKADHIKNLYAQSTKYSLLIMIPILSVLMIFGDSFLVLWLGEEFRKSYYVLLILGAGEIFALMQSIANQMLIGLGRHSLIGKHKIALAVIKIGLSIFLLQYFDILGVALGTTIPTLGITILVLIPISLKEFHFTLGSFLDQVIKIPFVFLLCSLGVLFMIDHIIIVNTWILFIGITMSFSLVYLVFLYTVMPVTIKSKVRSFF